MEKSVNSLYKYEQCINNKILIIILIVCININSTVIILDSLLSALWCLPVEQIILPIRDWTQKSRCHDCPQIALQHILSEMKLKTHTPSHLEKNYFFQHCMQKPILTSFLLRQSVCKQRKSLISSRNSFTNRLKPNSFDFFHFCHNFIF